MSVIVKGVLIRAMWCYYLPTKIGKDFFKNAFLTGYESTGTWINTESQRTNLSNTSFRKVIHQCTHFLIFYFLNIRSPMKTIATSMVFEMLSEIVMNQSINKSIKYWTIGIRLNYSTLILEYNVAI